MQIKTIKRYYFLNNRVANHKESVALGIIKYVCIGSIIHMCFIEEQLAIFIKYKNVHTNNSSFNRSASAIPIH